MRLKRRDRGMPSILRASWDNSAFMDKFVQDLHEIEQMNNRMERDIQAKTQDRIRKFGEDGSKILGVDIQVPLASPRSLPEFPRNPYFTGDKAAPPTNKREPPKSTKAGKSMFLTDIENPKSVRNSMGSESELGSELRSEVPSNPVLKEQGYRGYNERRHDRDREM